MGKGSLLLRFVDVVLILLFGFISISEVSQQSRIKLPESRETPRSYPDKEKVVFIGITRDGQYLVDDESRVITDLDALKNYIQQRFNFYRARHVKMRVRYRANYDTPVRYTIQAAQICDQLGIVKGIDVKLKSKF